MSNNAMEKVLAYLAEASPEKKRWLFATGFKLAHDDAVRSLEAKTARIAPELDPVETVRRLLAKAEKPEPE